MLCVYSIIRLHVYMYSQIMTEVSDNHYVLSIIFTAVADVVCTTHSGQKSVLNFILFKRVKIIVACILCEDICHNNVC